MKKSICTTAVTVALFGAALTPTMTAGSASAAPLTPAPAPGDISTRLLGTTVFLDPGHQGGGTAAQLDRLVDNGRGGRKPCETSGMTALGGMPEHTITWKVAELVRASLQNLGARVVMSRPDDVSWAGCVTDRARAANVSGAAVAISIHADGAPAADHGFHFIVPQLPIPNRLANAVQAGQGMAATKAVRDAYLRFGFQPANYAGTVDGLQTRADIAGPALTTVPDVFVEMGNGANSADAAALTTSQGQLRHALAITTGLVSYLLGIGPGGPVAQQMRTPAAGPGVAADVAQPAATPDDLPEIPLPSTVPATRAGQIDESADPNGGMAAGYAAVARNVLPALTTTLGPLTTTLGPLVTPLLGPLLGVLGLEGPELASAAGSLVTTLLATLAGT